GTPGSRSVSRPWWKANQAQLLAHGLHQGFRQSCRRRHTRRVVQDGGKAMRFLVRKRSRFAPSLMVAALLALAAPGALAQSVIDEAARQADEIERENSADREAERLRSIRRTFRAPSGEEPEAPSPVPSGPG